MRSGSSGLRRGLEHRKSVLLQRVVDPFIGIVHVVAAANFSPFCRQCASILWYKVPTEARNLTTAPLYLKSLWLRAQRFHRTAPCGAGLHMARPVSNTMKMGLP